MYLSPTLIDLVPKYALQNHNEQREIRLLMTSHPISSEDLKSLSRRVIKGKGKPAHLIPDRIITFMLPDTWNSSLSEPNSLPKAFLFNKEII